MTVTIDETEWLPAQPDTWGAEVQGFRQRWMPGAFGDLETIEKVLRFRVEQDEWHEDDDGNLWRTILRAQIIQ